MALEINLFSITQYGLLYLSRLSFLVQKMGQQSRSESTIMTITRITKVHG